MEVATQPPAPQTSEPRYRALDIVAKIYKVIAWLIAIVGTIAVIISAAAAGSSDEGGAGEAIGLLIGGLIGVAIYALLAFAFAEMIRLAMAVEENTRRTAELLSRNG